MLAKTFNVNELTYFDMAGGVFNGLEESRKPDDFVSSLLFQGQIQLLSLYWTLSTPFLELGNCVFRSEVCF